jgi:flagellar motility protein MotE (MotC chaperone)
MRLRVLPLVLFVAFTSVVVKVFDIIEYKTNLTNGMFTSDLQALAQDAGGKKTVNSAPEVKKDAVPASKDAPTKPADAAPASDKAAAEGAAAAAPDAGEEKNQENGATLSPGYSGSGPKELDITNMSDMEKNLLENLAKRRKELEDWSASIAMKENILNATEKKINGKMDDLKKLESEVKSLLDQYNEKEDQKTTHLVRIYESMKPQDAANIFETMELDVLLRVISKMKEAKAGKILAKMTPARAKEVTVELSKQRMMTVN